MSHIEEWDEEVWEVDTINGIVFIFITPENAHLSMRELYDLYGVVEYYDDPLLIYKQRAAQIGEEFDPSLYDFGDDE